MAYKHIPLSSLIVNRANDRHGELENETAAIAWLFSNQEIHMRNLAKDIAQQRQVYEPPLVAPEDNAFIVFDGNRRITCLKLLRSPKRAPTVELQAFFDELRTASAQHLPDQIECQIETDRDRIDDILFRRHTGSQTGVGQSNWDARMKANFVNRSGKEGGANVAAEIEKQLAAEGMLPKAKKIPWSTMNRLLSAEPFRNRVGFRINKNKFEFTHQESKVLSALSRIADDLANKRIVLNDVWNVDGKREYLDHLDVEGVLPAVRHALPKSAESTGDKTKPAQLKPSPGAKPHRRTTLIPNVSYSIAWSGRLQRHRAIWEELQFRLELTEHPNAISVLFRVLLELAIENYIAQVSLTTVKPRDNLAKRALLVADDLHSKGKISKRDFTLLGKFPQYDALVSADTLNRYVHSPNFAPSPEHLTALWDTLSNFIVSCLNI